MACISFLNEDKRIKRKNTINDIHGLRAAGRAAARIIREMLSVAAPGTTPYEIDQRAGEVMKQLNVRSAPKLIDYFPAHTCISVNSIIAHGVPDHRALRVGDQVNFDVAVELNGYYSDVAYTFLLGLGQHRLDHHCKVARHATFLAIRNSMAGTKLNAIAQTVENFVRGHGYTILKNLYSHGVGKTLHDHPANILNYFDSAETLELEPGMVIAWEPFVSSGASRAILSDKDNWSLTTHNHSRVVQYEHTVLITEGDPEILTVVK